MNDSTTIESVLVADADRTDEVRTLVRRLGEAGHESAEGHQRVDRPWGSYETVDLGARFRVKHITVRPGAKLSLQMHHHRSEHWVVVSGTCVVTCGDSRRLVGENEGAYIPVGVRHRIENPGHIALHLIEVQVGGYLEEDDIVRFDDIYGRS
jgi:mannose-1-phosphate guanylyltransferase/mannose-6-phosphate isomerase